MYCYFRSLCFQIIYCIVVCSFKENTLLFDNGQLQYIKKIFLLCNISINWILCFKTKHHQTFYSTDVSQLDARSGNTKCSDVHEGKCVHRIFAMTWPNASFASYLGRFDLHFVHYLWGIALIFVVFLLITDICLNWYNSDRVWSSLTSITFLWYNTTRIFHGLLQMWNMFQ